MASHESSAVELATHPANSHEAAISLASKFPSEEARDDSKSSRMERTLSATVPLLPPVTYSSVSTSSSLAN